MGVGLSLEANKLEWDCTVVLVNKLCIVVVAVSVSPGRAPALSCLLSWWETLQDQFLSIYCFFQITASALGPRACEILCVLFKNGVSISSNPLGLPKNPLAFKAKCSGNLSSWGRAPGLGSPLWGSELSAFYNFLKWFFFHKGFVQLLLNLFLMVLKVVS